MARRIRSAHVDETETETRELRAEMARLRLLEFRAESARKAERHAIAMSRAFPRPAPRKVSRGWAVFAVALFILACALLV